MPRPLPEELPAGSTCSATCRSVSAGAKLRILYPGHRSAGPRVAATLSNTIVISVHECGELGSSGTFYACWAPYLLRELEPQKRFCTLESHFAQEQFCEFSTGILSRSTTATGFCQSPLGECNISARRLEYMVRKGRRLLGTQAGPQ